MNIKFAVKDARRSLITAISDILEQEVVHDGMSVITYAAGGYIVKCTARQKNLKGVAVVNIRFNVTSAGRKAFAKAIGEILGCEAVYNGTPSFAYTVGNYTVDREGALICPADADCEEADRLIVALNERGYEVEAEKVPDYYSLQMTEREELGLGRERRDPPGENGMQASDVPGNEDEYPDIDQHHPGQYADPNVPPTEEMLQQAAAWMEGQPEIEVADTLAIEMPLVGFTPEKLDNLTKLVDSKATIFKKAFDTDDLSIRIVDDKISFPWFKLTATEGEVDAYTRFVCALCEMAKTLQRVTAKEKDGGNDKFTMRLFLIRLGFVGSEFKMARKILLRNLTGNTAWKDGQQPQKQSLLKCLHCGFEFNGTVETDELGAHSSCPECECSFDVDEGGGGDSQ